jgi:hypothetical protein
MPCIFTKPLPNPVACQIPKTFRHVQENIIVVIVLTGTPFRLVDISIGYDRHGI